MPASRRNQTDPVREVGDEAGADLIAPLRKTAGRRTTRRLKDELPRQKAATVLQAVTAPARPALRRLPQPCANRGTRAARRRWSSRSVKGWLTARGQAITAPARAGAGDRYFACRRREPAIGRSPAMRNDTKNRRQSYYYRKPPQALVTVRQWFAFCCQRRVTDRRRGSALLSPRSAT